jgi:hypothetical protein
MPSPCRIALLAKVRIGGSGTRKTLTAARPTLCGCWQSEGLLIPKLNFDGTAPAPEIEWQNREVVRTRTMCGPMLPRRCRWQRAIGRACRHLRRWRRWCERVRAVSGHGVPIGSKRPRGITACSTVSQARSSACTGRSSSQHDAQIAAVPTLFALMTAGVVNSSAPTCCRFTSQLLQTMQCLTRTDRASSQWFAACCNKIGISLRAGSVGAHRNAGPWHAGRHERAVGAMFGRLHGLCRRNCCRNRAGADGRC